MAAGVPVLLAITAVIATMGLANVASHVFPMMESVSSVILLVGMAVGVDYSLFYLRREREERAAGYDARTALQRAAATSGRSVLISGLTVLTAMAGMFFSGNKTFMSMGVGTMIVVAVAMIGSITVLPAMLAGLGDRIEKGRVPLLGRRRRNTESRVWSALIDRVLRHPVVAIVVAGGALLALTMPAFGMKTKETGPQDFPQDIPVIQTYNKIQKAFPGQENQAARHDRGERRPGLLWSSRRSSASATRRSPRARCTAPSRPTSARTAGSRSCTSGSPARVRTRPPSTRSRRFAARSFPRPWAGSGT